MDDIPEFRLIPRPTSDAARELTPGEWTDPMIGTRHKLGGKPDYLQGQQRPSCRSCGEEMTFYGQLDAIPDKERRYYIADCGLIYIFICFDCLETESFVQSG
jgi:hypothetical protein